MVSLYLLPVPGFHIRPFRIRGRPELIRLRQSQRDQAKSTKVDAPRIDIRLGDLDLFTCKAYTHQPFLSKFAGDFNWRRITEDNAQRTCAGFTRSGKYASKQLVLTHGKHRNGSRWNDRQPERNLREK